MVEYKIKEQEYVTVRKGRQTYEEIHKKGNAADACSTVSDGVWR